MQGSSDPLLVHSYFGPEIHRLRLETIKKPETDSSSLNKLASNTIFVFETFARQVQIPEFMKNSCLIENSPVDDRASNDDEISAIFEDLYENLLVSFALGAAGAHEASIRVLAEWINSADQTYEDLEKDSRAATSLDWARIRAKQYLAISLAMEGMHTARRDLLSDVTLDMEELFFSAAQEGVGGVLRDPDRWAEGQGLSGS